MEFWIIAGALTLAVAGLLVLAMLRGRGDEPSRRAQDIAVYRDQLAEVDRDLARGVLSQDEAERVRIEVSRRLLEADRADTVADAAANAARAPKVLTRIGAGLVGVGVAGAAVGLYLDLGAPGYMDLPIEKRIEIADTARANRISQAEAEAKIGAVFTPPPDADPKFLELMVKLRAAVAENPGEVQGQKLLARNEALLGNYAAAYPALGRVIEMSGDAATAQDYATYAELMILAAQGYVSPEAEDALKQALQRDPRNGPARYYSGLLYADTGRPDLAYRIWRPLLAESRPEAPWYPPIMAQIEQVAQAAGIRFTPPPSARPAAPFANGPGPSADDVAAASEMSAEERQDMIRGMVGRLADRLDSEGGSAQDWARLIGALGVLGDKTRAATAWADAQAALAGDDAGLAAVHEAAVQAGVAE